MRVYLRMVPPHPPGRMGPNMASLGKPLPFVGVNLALVLIGFAVLFHWICDPQADHS